MLGLGSSLAKGGASLLTFVKDNLKLYLDFKSNKSDTLKFPSEGSTEFDGSSNYIETSDSADFDFGTGNFSISFWFNVDDINWNWAVSRVNTANNADVYRGGTNNGGKLIFRDIAGSSDIIGSTTISANVWNHYTAVRNNGTLKLYLNGVEDASASSSGNFDSDKGFRIGRWQSSGDYWDGQLTNVAVWSRALTPEEIQSIMNKSYSQLKGVEKTSLVSWWALDSQSDGLVQPATGEVLGNEISGDPTFDNASNWSVSLGNGGVDVNTTVSGKLSVVNAQDTRLYKYSILTVGKLYKVTFVVDSYSSGRVRGLLDNAITFTPTGAGTYTRYFVASNTFFLVSFDGTANMTMTDISIKEVTSNTGVVTGATTTTSVYGGNAPILPRAVDVAKEGQADAIGDGSASFNGSTDYIDLGDSTDFDITNSITLSSWVNFNSTSTNVILARDDNTNENFILYGWSDGKIYGQIRIGGVGKTVDGGTYSLNVWYHVALTYDGSSLKIYVNGILQDTLSASGSIDNDDVSFEIGRKGNNAFHFDGKISQVGVWQGALTQAQIQSVMESTSYSNIPADVKSTLGAERVLNSDFSDGENLWNLTNASVVDGVLDIDIGAFTYYATQSTDSGGSIYRQYESGYLMKIVIVVDEYTSGSTIVYATGNNIGTFNSAGTHTIYYKPSANQYLILRSGGSGFEGKISSISIKRVTNDIVAYYPLDSSSSRGNGTDDVTTGEVLGDEASADPNMEGSGNNDDPFRLTAVEWSYDSTNNRLQYTKGGSGVVYQYNANMANSFVANQLYRIKFTIGGLTSGVARLRFSAGNLTYHFVDDNTVGYANGTHYAYFTTTGSGSASNGFAVGGLNTSGSSWYFTELSFKPVTSNTGVLK